MMPITNAMDKFAATALTALLLAVFPVSAIAAIAQSF